MTKTARADGRRKVTDRTSPVRIPLSPPEADCNDRLQPLTDAAWLSTSLMPIHDPATLEKFRQAAAACRSSRTKSRSMSGSMVAAAAGNGGVGRCAGGLESAALVPLSPSSFGHQATSPTMAETRFSQHAVEKYAAVAADDEESVDEAERLRRARGRRRSLAVVTTARWLHQLLPSKTGGSHAAAAAPKLNERPPLSPPACAVTSDDESATSDVETNLLRRASVHRDLGECPVVVGDDDDRRRSRDTFYSSTTTDRFRLSTASDSVSPGVSARPPSPNDGRCSPDVFHCIATNSDNLRGRRRTSSDTDALCVAVTTTTDNIASTDDNEDVNRVSDAVCINPTLLKPNACPVLRFELLTCSSSSYCADRE